MMILSRYKVTSSYIVYSFHWRNFTPRLPVRPSRTSVHLNQIYIRWNIILILILTLQSALTLLRHEPTAIMIDVYHWYRGWSWIRVIDHLPPFIWKWHFIFLLNFSRDSPVDDFFSFVEGDSCSWVGGHFWRKMLKIRKFLIFLLSFSYEKSRTFFSPVFWEFLAKLRLFSKIFLNSFCEILEIFFVNF